MGEFIFLHNMDTCIGCGACQVACQDCHGLLPGEFFRRMVGVEPDGRRRFLSLACAHCTNPACVAACPHGVFSVAPDGTVRQDSGMCIGCGRCVWSCPYGAISLSLRWGTAQKCDGCSDRRAQGLAPVCVAACVNGSLQFIPGGAEHISGAACLSQLVPSETKPRVWLSGVKGGEGHG